MRNQNTISGHRMTTLEFLSFSNGVLEAAAKVKQKEFAALLPDYANSVEKFKAYANNSVEKAAKKESSESGIERSNMFRDFRNYVKTVCKHPDETVKSLGLEIWGVVKPYGARVRHNTKIVSGMVEVTLAKTREIVAKECYAAVYAGSDLEKWVAKLTEQQEAYDETLQVCAAERASRRQDTNDELRDACMAHFYTILHFAEYQANVKKDSDCTEFVKSVKEFMNSHRSTYTARTNYNTKKRTEKDAAQETALETPQETATVDSSEQQRQRLAT